MKLILVKLEDILKNNDILLELTNYSIETSFVGDKKTNELYMSMILNDQDAMYFSVKYNIINRIIDADHINDYIDEFNDEFPNE